jgi:hypothetical protein
LAGCSQSLAGLFPVGSLLPIRCFLWYILICYWLCRVEAVSVVPGAGSPAWCRFAVVLWACLVLPLFGACECTGIESPEFLSVVPRCWLYPVRTWLFPIFH